MKILRPTYVNLHKLNNLTCRSNWYLQLRTFGTEQNKWDVSIIYKYDIRVGFPPGITSPREDCRSRAYPTRMSYLFYYTEQYKTQKGENYKHQRFWINILVVCLVELVSPVGHSANSVGVRALFFGLAVIIQLIHGCCRELFNYFITC